MASKMKDLKDLLVHKMKDLLDVETRLIEALPQMAEQAGDEKLKMALEQHLEETQAQLERLKQSFEHVGARASRVACKGIQGILEEGEEVMEKASGDAKDAAILAAAQAVEHYEICGYGTAATYAERLGLKPLAKTLRQTLEEEEQTDRKLTELATSGINEAAAA